MRHRWQSTAACAAAGRRGAFGRAAPVVRAALVALGSAALVVFAPVVRAALAALGSAAPVVLAPVVAALGRAAPVALAPVVLAALAALGSAALDPPPAALGSAALDPPPAALGSAALDPPPAASPRPTPQAKANERRSCRFCLATSWSSPPR